MTDNGKIQIGRRKSAKMGLSFDAQIVSIIASKNIYLIENIININIWLSRWPYLFLAFTLFPYRPYTQGTSS